MTVKMYDLVKGTSNSSRYGVIGVNGELILAMRCKGSSFSIRADAVDEDGFESPTKNKLLQLGFNDKGSMEYVSMHMSFSDDIEAMKMIGALWYSVHGHFPLNGGKAPDYSKIKVMGTI